MSERNLELWVQVEMPEDMVPKGKDRWRRCRVVIQARDLHDAIKKSRSIDLEVAASDRAERRKK